MTELDIKRDKVFADFHTFVICAFNMYKILVFVAFLFYLVNSEYTKDCPSGYFDGKDGYCYHIGTEDMSQSEAEKYCEIKHWKTVQKSGSI